jgi:D-citramalate synthase
MRLRRLKQVDKYVIMSEQVVLMMDTTLRDGEQTSGVSFTAVEKLTLSKVLLEEVKVDRIEIASARVSEGERDAAEQIIQWADDKGYSERIEILGFVDGGKSIDWIVEVGGKVINLLAKGSLKHVQGQLRKTPEEHLEDIKTAIQYASGRELLVNLYLEDWSNGMRDSREYVYFLLEGLKGQPIRRLMLPDTLGILTPHETYEFCLEVTSRFPEFNFDFHAHNDYDLAVANVMEAVRAGVTCVHTTVNGLGERAGNSVLSSVNAAIRDHLDLNTNVVEQKLYKVSKLVESFSGQRIPSNKPLIGDNVFTQTCGVHADGDSKDNLYFNKLMPERFGRTRKYALGKTSGKANIKQNLSELGIELEDAALKKVTQRVIELGDKKETVTVEDLPYIVADVMEWETIQERVKVVNYNLAHAKGLKPVASVAIELDGNSYESSASGDGQYDAFVKALKNIYAKLKQELPKLIDYSVSIPPGGKSDAICETTITWDNGREFKTKGIDTDQTFAAIKATEKMLNIIHVGPVIKTTRKKSNKVLV